MFGELKLPGGGIDEGEDDYQALMREVKEETGYEVIPETIVPFGEIEEKRLSVHEPKIWHQFSRLYFCDVYPEQGECNYSENEKKYEFRQVLCSLDEALEVNRAMLEREGKQAWNQREYKTLLLVKEHMEQKKHNCTTLCYIENDDSYLMMHRVKKEKDINKDKWIGVGGHFEEGESPEDCLLREVREETGLELTSFRFRGVVTFVTDVYPTEYMFLYTADGYTGEITECNEGNLEWVKKSAVYDLPIWEGDKVFFRLLEKDIPTFSLKLRYEGERLVETVLNGTVL